MPTGNNPAKRLLFNTLGVSICVIPVAVTIFSYFPLWIGREDASILSGVSLLLIGVALVPLFTYFRQILKSASAPVMWFILFVTFFLLSKIADEVTVISFVGLTTNLIGTLLFKLAKKYGPEED